MLNFELVLLFLFSLNVFKNNFLRGILLFNMIKIVLGFLQRGF